MWRTHAQGFERGLLGKLISQVGGVSAGDELFPFSTPIFFKTSSLQRTHVSKG